MRMRAKVYDVAELGGRQFFALRVDFDHGEIGLSIHSADFSFVFGIIL